MFVRKDQQLKLPEVDIKQENCMKTMKIKTKLSYKADSPLWQMTLHMKKHHGMMIQMEHTKDPLMDEAAISSELLISYMI